MRAKRYNPDKIQTQKAIECLNDVYDFIIKLDLLKDTPNNAGYYAFREFIEDKIKELEGEKE